MKLVLDQMQRISLCNVIGAQRCNLEEARRWWRHLDRLELSEEERAAVNFRTELIKLPDGREAAQVLWDAGKQVPVREFEFPPEDFSRLRKMIEEFSQQQAVAVGSDRRWLEPLLEQLENGQPKSYASDKIAVPTGNHSRND